VNHGTLEIRGSWTRFPSADPPSLTEGTNIKVGVAGQGAFGHKALDAIQNIPGMLITLTGGNAAATRGRDKYKITSFYVVLAES